MSMQILKSVFRTTIVPGFKAPQSALAKLDPHSPLSHMTQDIFQQLKQEGVHSKLGWDSEVKATYIRPTLKDGTKLDRIYFSAQRATTTTVHDLRENLLAALKQAKGNTQVKNNYKQAKKQFISDHGYVSYLKTKSPQLTNKTKKTQPLTQHGPQHQLGMNPTVPTSLQPATVTHHGLPRPAVTEWPQLGETGYHGTFGSSPNVQVDDLGIPLEYHPGFNHSSTNLLQESVVPTNFTAPGTVNLMHQLLGAIQPADITNVLKHIPANQRNNAKVLMNRMTQFGNFKSLENLHAQLNEQAANGYPIFITRDDSLAGVLKYVAGKQKHNGLFNSETFAPGDIMFATKGSILLDKNVIQQFQNDPKLLSHIQKNDFKLFYPEGFDEGLNFLHMVTPTNLLHKTNDLLGQATALGMAGEQNPLRKAVSYATQISVQNLGLGHKFSLLSNTARANTGHVIPGAEHIASNLAPQTMSSQQLESVLQQFPNEQYRKAAITMLQQNSNIFSPQYLAEIAQQKHGTIMNVAYHKGIDPQNIIYYIPTEGKSYSMVTMQHAYVNGIHPSQVVTDASKIPNNANNMVVILDDVAGSGHSLKSAYKELRGYSYFSNGNGYKGPVVISPTVSTTTAEVLLGDLAKNETYSGANTGGMHYLPNKVARPFKDSSFYKQASPREQKVYDEMLGSLGYGENGLNVVFPYMAPDNNNYFFANLIAPKYLLNGLGAKNCSLGMYKFPVASGVSVTSPTSHSTFNVPGPNYSMFNVPRPNFSNSIFHYTPTGEITVNS